MAHIRVAGLATAWTAVVLAGFTLLARYKETPGSPAEPPAHWPEESAIARATERGTLLMLAHPMCPCTRASLDELAVVVRETSGLAAVHVLFMKPPAGGASWENTELWQKARAIPGVRVELDRDGGEAARFGAKVSGHALLYDRDGALVFSGGITAARGHVGNSLGRERLLALLGGHSVDRPDAPTFGCSLVDPNQKGR
jgi:hypothetical protein